MNEGVTTLIQIFKADHPVAFILEQEYVFSMWCGLKEESISLYLNTSSGSIWGETDMCVWLCVVFLVMHSGDVFSL